MVKVFTFTVFHAVQSAAYTMEMCAVELHGLSLLRRDFGGPARPRQSGTRRSFSEGGKRVRAELEHSLPQRVVARSIVGTMPKI